MSVNPRSRGLQEKTGVDPLQLERQVRGMELADIKRLKVLEEENQKLKRMFADLSLKHEALKDVVEKNVTPVMTWPTSAGRSIL